MTETALRILVTVPIFLVAWTLPAEERKRTLAGLKRQEKAER